jgi:ATP-dependent exoDNAse (exonuclease V) beta subunit
MVVDHINGNAEDNSHDNLGLNCPACDAIRHCGFSEKKDLIELRISKLSQEEIVKKSCEFYIKNGKNPSYKDIDPHSKETHLTPIEIVKSSQKGEINDSNFKVFFTNQMDFSYLDFSYKSDIISPFKNEIQELEIKTSKHHFLKELNYQQKIAVLNQRKKVCVIAGPGCGKTKTIVSRAIHLIENEKINSENILLITFSKRAAGEIENRFSEIHFLNDISSLGIFNLHSFCYRLLRENHQFLNLKKEAIDVCDNRYQAYLFKKILKGLNSPLSRDNKEISSLLSLIRFCKVTEDLGFSLLQNDKLRLKSAIKYQQYLKKNELFDYSDLLIYTKNTLLEYFEVRQNYQNKFSHILVDEFQDINKIQ